MNPIIWNIIGLGIPPAVRKIRVCRLENALEKVLNLKDGESKQLTKVDYLGAVTHLLRFVEKRFGRWGRSCNLVGTTLFLPSEWMGVELSIYRTIWDTHAKNVGKQDDEGRYHAVRIICNSYQRLSEEVDNSEKKEACQKFFDWCSRRYFKIRVLVTNHEKLFKGQDIELKDFMLFNKRFVFGSEDRPDEDLIKCLMCCKSKRFTQYMNLADTVIKNENSVEIQDVDGLENMLKTTKSWD